MRFCRISPYYPKGIAQNLTFIYHFAPYNKVIKATNDANVKFKINNIALQFDKISHKDLATGLKNKYIGLPKPYDKVMYHSTIDFKKSDTTFSVNLNIPAKSLKGVALFFKDVNDMKDYAHKNETFYNPSIKNISTTIEGVSNKLFSHGFQPQHAYEEAKKYFCTGDTCMTLGDFLTQKYCIWLDFRSTTDPKLHGSGLRLMKTNQGIHLNITRHTETPDGTIKCFVFYVCDAQLNIEHNQYRDHTY